MPRTATPDLNAAVSASVVPGTTYNFSLHGGDVGTTGANEFSGGGYARQPIVFGTAAAGIELNTTTVSVPNAGSTPATHWGLWTVGGVYKTGGALTASATGTPITFAVGVLAVAAA